MGNYSYDDHVDLFGGPPEPGEGVDWRDYVDQERKAAKEDPSPRSFEEFRESDLGRRVGEIAAEGMAPRRPWWRRWRRGA